MPSSVGFASPRKHGVGSPAGDALGRLAKGKRASFRRASRFEARDEHLRRWRSCAPVDAHPTCNAAYNSDTNFAASDGFGHERIFLSRTRLTSHPQSPVLRQVAAPMGGMFDDTIDWSSRPRAEASATEDYAMEGGPAAGRRHSTHSGKPHRTGRRSESRSRQSGVMVTLRSSPISVQPQRSESFGAERAAGRSARAHPAIPMASMGGSRSTALPAVVRPRASGDARQRSTSGISATSSSGRIIARTTISRLQIPRDDPRDAPPRRLDPLPGRGHRSRAGSQPHGVSPEDLSLQAFIKKHDHAATLDAVVERFALQGRVISQGLTAHNSLLYLPPTPDAGKVVIYLGPV